MTLRLIIPRWHPTPNDAYVAVSSPDEGRYRPEKSSYEMIKLKKKVERLKDGNNGCTMQIKSLYLSWFEDFVLGEGVSFEKFFGHLWLSQDDFKPLPCIQILEINLIIEPSVKLLHYEVSSFVFILAAGMICIHIIPCLAAFFFRYYLNE